MRTLQIVLSVVDALALVGVLAVYLLLIARRLRSIAATLGRIASGTPALDGRAASSEDVARLNWRLERLASALPDLAERTERLAGRR